MKYTRQELINELYRVYNELGRVPKSSDMLVSKGRIGIDQYYIEFGTWSIALQEAGFKLNKVRKYTQKMIIDAFHKFVHDFDKIPTCKDFDNTYGYPSPTTVAQIYGTWNNALQIAGLNIHKSWHKNSENDKCSICGSTTTTEER